MARFDPSRPDFSPYGLTVERWTPAPMTRPDRHNEIEINLLERGSLTYLLGGRKVRVYPGRLTLFWAAIPHQIIAVENAGSYHVATIPLAWFLQWQLPTELVGPILHGSVVSEPLREEVNGREQESENWDTECFRRWHRGLKKPTKVQRRIVLLEMEARLLRLASALPTNTAKRRPRTLPSDRHMLTRAESIACFIARNYQREISPAQIGSALGLHPNYAMNLFKKTFSTTLSEYVTQHRLSHAQRLLATTDQKVLRIALESGFGSISRFNTVFRRSFRTSPREYRKQHRL